MSSANRGSPTLRAAVAASAALCAAVAGLIASADRSRAAFPPAHSGPIAYSAGADNVIEVGPTGENPTNVTPTTPG